MAMWSTFGDYLENSGWTTALTQAGIASAGTADSFLRCSHLTRTRQAHQITALALAKLQYDAFASTSHPQTDEVKEIWKIEMIGKSPTFQYWNTILNKELMGLVFIRAHREANFSLYVDTLKALCPWFFALDHQNYARWIPVHIRDMEKLPSSIKDEFAAKGHWVVCKTTNRFSAMPIDQAHEQNNEMVKGSGGVIGLTQNPSAFRKWMLAGPEQARLLQEIEESFAEETKNCFHHEEGLSIQKHFRQQALNLAETMSEMGNPFLNDTPELLTLDNSNVMNESVVDTVRTIEAVGKNQYDDYCKSVLIDCTRSIHRPIKKNSPRLFRCPVAKQKTKQADKITNLKTDVDMFSRLYIVSQHRETDMDVFFMHENHPYPVSLSEGGNVRIGKKSDLLTCLIEATDTETSSADMQDLEDNTDLFVASTQLSSRETAKLQPPSTYDIKVLDGATIVHLLSPNRTATFDEYANYVFLPYIVNLLETSKRVDIVWDTYLKTSIKDCTREKRGIGIRRKVAGKNKIPGNWPDFLRDSNNKRELFAFLSDKVAAHEFPPQKEVAITSDQRVIIRGSEHSMQESDHEEADTRILLHVQDALLNNSTTCLVRTVDTDVIVILIGKFHHLQGICPAADIWVAFGTGKCFTYIHINAIVQAIGKDKSMVLPVFHSFTGCDTVSAFFGKGKKSAWDAWKSYPDVTVAFMFWVENPFTKLDVDAEQFRLLERFIVVLYDKTSHLTCVNEARREMFCQKSQKIETLPPTQDALLQHSNRAAYQAGIWLTCNLPQQQVPSPEGFGWKIDKKKNSWIPVWTTIPVASKACSELVKCGCKGKTGCGVRCTCKKAHWRCTELCKCKCSK